MSLTPACSSAPAPPIISSSANPACAGDVITLDAGSGYDTYLWPNGASSRTIRITPSTTTSYSVIGYGGSCPSTSTSFTQNVGARPAAAAIASFSPAAGFAGDIVTISAA